MIDPISRHLHRTAGQHGPVALMYHAVLSDGAEFVWPWAVSVQQFRNHLDFLLAEGWTTPTISELLAGPEVQATRTVAITFDDGYAGNLTAYNELAKRGMRATWYIVSGSIGDDPNWPADGRPVGRLLDAEELRSMQASGMEIGSHTVSHLRLTDADDADLHRELRDSKAQLENVLARPVLTFAYPYGAWDARSELAVKQAGYASACTTRTGWALRDRDPFRLRRLTVFNGDTAGALARKLCLGSNDVSWRALARYGLDRLGARLAW